MTLPARTSLWTPWGSHSPSSGPQEPWLMEGAIPMTVRWVLAVMLATTLVATHSHSPWSSLLSARNWRLPLGRALCLLLLGFPTLAKQGGSRGAGGGGGGGRAWGRGGQKGKEDGQEEYQRGKQG